MSRKEEEENRLASYVCPEVDPLETTGVLLSNEIEEYVQKFKLIEPFYAGNLKPAGYELTAGHLYAIGGDFGELVDQAGKDEVKIPPFEVLIIQTRETVNFPRFLIGRWNIRVAWAYKGLLWVGGPQVDPGFVGHLSCPIYNLSNKEVTLKLGEPIALIDFVKTTPFRKNLSREYPRPPKRVLFEDYEPNKLQSALFTEAGERLKRVEGELTTFESRTESRIKEFEGKINTSIATIETKVNSVTASIFPVLAILFATLTLLVGSLQKVTETFPWWFYVSSGLSTLAVVLSIAALIKSRRS